MFSKHNQSFRLALQITLINATALLSALIILILSLNFQYKRTEVSLAREKLSIFWTEVLGLTTISQLQAIRNTYERDLEYSEKLYAVRIVDYKYTPLLLEYPKAWNKYFSYNMDFDKSMESNKPFRISLIQGDQEMLTPFVVYSLKISNYTVQIFISIEERIQFISSVLRFGLAIIIGAIILSFLVAQLVILRVLSPLHNINKIIDSIINNQHIDQRLIVKGRGEFERLQNNFNTMLNVIEQQVSRLRQAAINLGHDIRTPLTRIRNSLEEILISATDSNIQDKIETSLEFIDEIKIFAKKILDLSEIDSKLVHIPDTPINIAKTIDGVLDMYMLMAEEKNITMETHIDNNIEMFIDGIRLQQLFSNLLDNAVKFSHPNSKIIVKVFKRINRKICIEVRDFGIGIEKEDKPNIWAPAWRKSENDKNSSNGFGLAIVDSIVRAYKGTIKVISEKNKGTLFVVLF